MAKRIYSESIKSWLIKNKLLAGGSGTLIGALFLYLSMIGAISNYTYSGDTVCAGTIDNPCYAYINFTANEDIFIYPTNYDPYGRNTSFNFDPNVKSWKLQRSWGTSWRNIPLNKSCTGTWCGLSNKGDKRKFSVAFRKGKDYQIRIVALKNNPYETIKWSAFKVIDPEWIGLTDITKATKEDVFKELISNDASKTEAVIKLRNPMNSKEIKRKDIKVNFNEACGHIKTDEKGNKKYKLLINSTCKAERIKEEIKDIREVCYNESINNTNITREKDLTPTKNITKEICYNETYVKETIYENYTYPCFKEFEKIEANDLRNIKVDVDKKDIVFDDCSDGFGYEIDWQVETTLDDGISKITLDKPEWEWWNISYDSKRNITDVPDVDLTLNVNGTSSFYGNRIFVNPANCNGDLAIYYKSTNTSDYAVVCNDTTEITWTANDLVSYWKLDEASGDAIDSEGSNDGTVHGATQGATGKINDAYSFVAANEDYVIADGVDLGNSVSYSLWLKTTSDGATAFSNGKSVTGEYESGLIGVGEFVTFKVYLSNNDIQYISYHEDVVNDGEWHLITITRAATKRAKIYIDGAEQTVGRAERSSDWSGTIHYDAGDPILFGMRLVNGVLYGTNYNGILDEVGIWSRELNSTEVSAYYNNTKDSFNNMLLGAEESVPVYTMSGTVKDSSNVVVNNATVIIIDQSDNTITGTTNSNSTGGWTYNVDTGTYLVVAYDPNNITRDGDADPHIVVS